jgi:hypothetical protein
LIHQIEPPKTTPGKRLIFKCNREIREWGNNNNKNKNASKINFPEANFFCSKPVIVIDYKPTNKKRISKLQFSVRVIFLFIWIGNLFHAKKRCKSPEKCSKKKIAGAPR